MLQFKHLESTYINGSFSRVLLIPLTIVADSFYRLLLRLVDLLALQFCYENCNEILYHNQIIQKLTSELDFQYIIQKYYLPKSFLKSMYQKYKKVFPHHTYINISM